MKLPSIESKPLTSTTYAMSLCSVPNLMMYGRWQMADGSGMSWFTCAPVSTSGTPRCSRARLSGLSGRARRSCIRVLPGMDRRGGSPCRAGSPSDLPRRGSYQVNYPITWEALRGPRSPCAHYSTVVYVMYIGLSECDGYLPKVLLAVVGPSNSKYGYVYCRPRPRDAALRKIELRPIPFWAPTRSNHRPLGGPHHGADRPQFRFSNTVVHV